MNEGRFHIDIEQEVLKETALVYDHASGLSACKRHEPSELKLLSMIQITLGLAPLLKEFRSRVTGNLENSFFLGMEATAPAKSRRVQLTAESITPRT